MASLEYGIGHDITDVNILSFQAIAPLALWAYTQDLQQGTLDHVASMCFWRIDPNQGHLHFFFFPPIFPFGLHRQSPHRFSQAFSGEIFTLTFTTTIIQSFRPEAFRRCLCCLVSPDLCLSPCLPRGCKSDHIATA